MTGNICCLTCTYGRHSCLERVVKFYIDQTYEGNSLLLIYNNSPIEQRLNITEELPSNKKILLYNKLPNRNYNNTGDIFEDALSLVPEEYDIITNFDDDDLFLKHHLEAGNLGMEEAYKENKLAYKPYYSYYKDSQGIHTVHNTIEPSIFVDAKFLREIGFRKTTVDYHQQWINPLIKEDKILIPKEAPASMIYNWDGKDGVFKISGSHNNLENFNNHKKNSLDEGDEIITPISDEKAQYYYNLVK